MKKMGNLLYKYFIVCVGDERIYWGFFMDTASSLSPQHPVIWLIPRHPDGRNTTPEIITISPAPTQPSPDPRGDQRVYDVLDETGVLVDLYTVP